MDFTGVAIVLLTLLHAAAGLALLQQMRISAGQARPRRRWGRLLRRCMQRLR